LVSLIWILLPIYGFFSDPMVGVTFIGYPSPGLLLKNADKASVSVAR
jgi:hypothetical protein